MGRIRATYILLSFIIEMIKNKNNLNDELENNYNVCKNFCQNVVDKSKINYIVNGKENIPDKGPLLIASNHRSFFDILLLISAIDRSMPYAAAKELYKYPLLKRYLNSLNCVVIDRSEEELSKIKKELEEIKNAISTTGLILFPEGECSYYDEEIKMFKKGGFIGVNQNTSIVPTYIDVKDMNNSFKWYVPKGDVTISFGESFKPCDVFDKCNAKKLSEYTRGKVLELKNNI